MDTQTHASEQARQELLALHADDRRAHFATDAAALVARQAESFVYVGDGAIQRIARDDMRQTFEQYFKNATYYEWDDLEPPIVQVSQDGSLGWMITRTKVRRTQADESGAAHEREFIYAGVMTYEKRDGRWVRTANVSTFEYLKT
jgi:ketosteroid isomerase-like protein